jgi:hypothetical protein
MADDITGIEGELRSNGINVEELELDSTVQLTYMTSFPGEEVAHREMGRVLNTFIDLAEDDDWEPSRLEATVVRTPGDVQGSWHAEPEWFEGLLSYRLSETEFSTRVLETLDEESDATEAGR